MKTLSAIILGALLGSTAPVVAAEIKAVASFSILGDMVARVGGDRLELTTIVGPNADSHVYEPKPADAVALGEAQIFFVNGLEFEGWLTRLVEATGYTGTVVVASDGVHAHDMAEAGHEGEEDEHAGHDHGEMDPHAWQSLANGLVYVDNIAKGLCAVDAEGCPVYEANADAYKGEIAALDAEVKSQIAAVPAAQRKVITTHDAFGYFGEEYGVEFLAPQGVSTDSEASAADVAALIGQIRTSGVKAVFVENMSDGRLVEQIASETGAVVGGELFADALSEPDQDAGTYLDMFRHNVGLLVPAMQGK